MAHSKDEDILLVDDFNDSAAIEMKNRLNVKINAWKNDPDDESQWCKISREDKVFVGKSGNSMKIDYNIASNKTTYVEPRAGISPDERGLHSVAYNGFVIEFDSMDLSSYKYLVFSAKGDEEKGFTRSFKLELKNKERSASVIFDKLTSRWQKFFIPLDQFSSVIDLKDTRSIVFVFDQNVTKRQGVFYVDDIYFAKNRDADLYSSVDSEAKIHYSRRPLKIDGNLKKWEKVRGLTLKSDKNLESGQVSDDQDLSAHAYFQWDKQYLYFAIQVKDNDVECMRMGKDIYQSDSVELFIDPAMDGLIWGNSADYQLGFSPTGPYEMPQVWAWFQNEKPSVEDVKYATKVEKDGYIIEAAISWKFLLRNSILAKDESVKIPPPAGSMIGISVAVNDLDVKDDTPKAKLNWHFVADSKESTKYQLGAFQLVETGY